MDYFMGLRFLPCPVVAMLVSYGLGIQCLLDAGCWEGRLCTILGWLFSNFNLQDIQLKD